MSIFPLVMTTAEMPTGDVSGVWFGIVRHSVYVHLSDLSVF